MQKRTTTTAAEKAERKGFTVHVGETYVGYLIIGEKNVPAATLTAMQDPDNMAAILNKADLRPFKEAEDADMSAIDAIIAGVTSPAEPMQAVG